LESDYTRESEWSNADWKAMLTLLEKDLAQALLDELTPVQREVLLMRYIEGWTPKEIARIRQVSVQTAKNELTSAKAALREGGQLDAYRLVARPTALGT